MTISPAEFMAAEDRCDVTELLVSQCAHCRGAVAPVRRSPSAGAPVRTAQYDSTCMECGQPIEAGVDEITTHDDGPWIHAECAEDA